MTKTKAQLHAQQDARVVLIDLARHTGSDFLSILEDVICNDLEFTPEALESFSNSIGRFAWDKQR